jgi:hypothetical protein
MGQQLSAQSLHYSKQHLLLVCICTYGFYGICCWYVSAHVASIDKVVL